MGVLSPAREGDDAKRLAPWGLEPGRLWSLWDMLRVHAVEFFGLGSNTTKIAETIFFGDGRGGGNSLHDFQKEKVRESIIALADLCERIGLPTSLALLKDRHDNIPQTRREWEIIVDAVRAELKTNLFLFVPAHRSKYYEMTLESAVTMAFPTGSKELVAAGNSLAVGLYTACVFHSMRAAEIGVRVLGAKLGVTFPNHPCRARTRDIRRIAST